jgi:hypothetical protein
MGSKIGVSAREGQGAGNDASNLKPRSGVAVAAIEE